MRVWTYVISTDGGTAPNFDPPCATLAICKPRIRRCAVLGDMLVAFNGKALSRDPHSVRWAGQVSDIMPLERYWNDRRFRNKRPDRTDRPDNIYRLENGVLVQEKNDIHFAANVATDLRGVNALGFARWWYFGAIAPTLPQAFGLRMSGGRRNEPLRVLEASKAETLFEWLNGQPQQANPPSASAAGCNSRQAKRISTEGGCAAC